MKYYHLVGDIVIPVSSELQEEGIKRLKKFNLILDIYKKKDIIPEYCNIVKVTDIEKKIKIKKSLFSRPKQVRLTIALYLTYYVGLYEDDSELSKITALIFDTIRENFESYLEDKYQLTISQLVKLEKYYDYVNDYLNSIYYLPEFEEVFRND